MTDDSIKLARSYVENSKMPVILTGAGISAESDIPTFRGAGGYWRNKGFEELACSRAFCENPREQWDWYLERRRTCWLAEPNPGHFAITNFLKNRSSAVLVTQNVDGLHERAGSDAVRIHGSIWENKCSRCLEVTKINPPDHLTYDNLPVCVKCEGPERVGVVWFGESIPTDAFVAAEKAIEDCDLLIVVGTSGTVYPAAAWIGRASNKSAPVIEINPTPAFGHYASVLLRGANGEFLPKIFVS